MTSSMQSRQSLRVDLKCVTSGRTGYPIVSNDSATRPEQIARVGSPLPNAIILRRHEVGTGGVGNRYRARSTMFRVSYARPIWPVAWETTRLISPSDRPTGLQTRQ